MLSSGYRSAGNMHIQHSIKTKKHLPSVMLNFYVQYLLYLGIINEVYSRNSRFSSEVTITCPQSTEQLDYITR